MNIAKHIKKHLNNDNLHHAYLIEGQREEIVPEILKFVESLGIDPVGNSDVTVVSIDTFAIEDARNLKSYGTEKGLTALKRIFIISANSFLLEAQNTMLKMFEEPIENTHFFVITPDANALLKTLVSRFYFISAKPDLLPEVAEKFISMPLQKRIDFLKELLVEAEEEDEDGNEIVVLDSARSKAIKFLNVLELVLHKKIFIQGKENRPHENPSVLIPFRQIFKVREFLRMPGSSTKTLMESVALVVPNF